MVEQIDATKPRAPFLRELHVLRKRPPNLSDKPLNSAREPDPLCFLFFLRLSDLASSGYPPPPPSLMEPQGSLCSFQRRAPLTNREGGAILEQFTLSV